MQPTSSTPRLLTRREAIARLGGGFGALGLAGALGHANLLASPLAHFAPRAKRVIFLFMNGAPSHVDTFDPKPALKRWGVALGSGDFGCD